MNNILTWGGLRDFLNGLDDNDQRLNDRVIVFDTEIGEERPCDVMESNDNDNPFVSDNQLMIMSYPESEMDKIENRTPS